VQPIDSTALEPDDALLEKRISTARALMTSRLIELISARKNIGEIRAIQKALTTLVAIKYDRGWVGRLDQNILTTKNAVNSPEAMANGQKIGS
jgi:hypothetical protein